MRIVIIGGGPTGLGAAWRLSETGHEDWTLYEMSDRFGGLSTSFKDDEGFWWDIGGHVLFSHYKYFDKIMDTVLGENDGWLFHEREAWVWMQDRFIPYPLQNNIHRLPKEIFWECLKGVMDLSKLAPHNKPADFAQWIDMTFGAGLAKWFLRPYNYKVWAYPPEEMGWNWTGERVAPVALEGILENSVFDKDSISWGPNSTFRFPLYGGTGGIWNSMAEKLPSSKMIKSKKIASVSSRNKKIFFEDGSSDEYDILLSTMPLTRLVEISDLDSPYNSAPKLKHSSTHVVGIGLKGRPPEKLSTKCWMYFPEDNCPFYRVTVFSNYSPNNVPDSACSWSLMCEVSESPLKNVDKGRIVEEAIQGCLNTKLIGSRQEINHTWHHSVEHGYPTPSKNRDELLFPCLKKLQDLGIYSRGRFGGWKYEVGNMDHSFMQGVEFASSVLDSGEEMTLWYPSVVNSLHPLGMKR